MLKIHVLTSYKKDYKRLKKSGRFKEEIFSEVIYKLSRNEPLEERYKDHRLSGPLAHLRECHIGNDLLLIYEVAPEKNLLYLVRIGSHSELFG